MVQLRNQSSPQPTDYTIQFDHKMTAEGIDPIVRETFLYYYRQILKGETGLIHNHQISPILPEEVIDGLSLVDYKTIGTKNLSRTVRIVLNGGLGTSMGLSLPKSLVPARDKTSFLDLILRQAAHDQVRLVLMNSFHTQQATQEALLKTGADGRYLHFLQNKFPKILQQNLAPAEYPPNPQMEWNPPGHGDLFTALSSSGTLDTLIADGIRFAYISNCDNLGASIELGILGYFSQNEIPFMMEVSLKTSADVKGGHLAKLHDGRLILRESAQCPEAEMDAFRDISTFRYFNTNSIWVNLSALKEHLSQEGFFKLPLIRNPKTLNPLDPQSPPVFQVESAMGAAITLFPGAQAVEVPRNRFFPVKKCNELLAVRSDRYELSDRSTLQFSPGSLNSHPIIDLDPQFFGKIEDFEERFPQGPPSLKRCRRLTVKGNVFFGKQVVLVGDVTILNHSSKAAIIDDGSVLDGSVTF